MRKNKLKQRDPIALLMCLHTKPGAHKDKKKKKSKEACK